MNKQLATTAMLLAVWLVPQSASAARICKSQSHSMIGKSEQAAKHKWGLKMAELYGAEWAFIGKAKNKKSYRRPKRKKNGKFVMHNAFRATPCIKKNICRGTIKAKGMFYYKKSKAVSSAQGRWEFAAAAKYTSTLAHWKKSRGKQMNCTKGHGNKGNLWNCKAAAKPCI